MKLKNISVIFVISLIAIVSISCKKANDSNSYDNTKTYKISGYASGAQVVPSVNSGAAGSIDGSINAATNTLQYTLKWNGLSSVPVGMHFHGPAVAAVNANVTIPVTNYIANTSGVLSNTVKLSDAQEADLMNGRWYYDIHTQTNTNGELRGQIIIQ